MGETRKHIASKDCWCNPEVVAVEGKGSTVAHRVESAEEALKPLQVGEPTTVEVNVVMGAQTRAIVRSALLHVRNKMRDRTDIEDESQERIISEIDAELVKWPLGGEAEDTLDHWLYNRFGRLMERLDPTEVAKNWEQLEEDGKLYWSHEAAAVRRAVGRGGFKTSPDEIDINHPISELHEANARSGNMVKGYRQLDLKNAESLGEAIRIAVGAASTCWTNMMGAGVFKSEEALDIATQLEHHIMAYITRGLGEIGQRHDALARRLRAYRDRGDTMVNIQQVYAILSGTTTPEEYTSALQPRPATPQERDRANG